MTRATSMDNPMLHDWIRTIETLQAARTACVLVSVASVKGSAPRPPGTKMIVTADALHGTIGGGHLEFTAVDIARRQLDGATGPPLRRFPLGASLGQCCGGVVNLLFEPVPAATGWVMELVEVAADRRPFAIVTPAHGALQAGKLLVTPDTVRGTLGRAQARAVALARAALADGGGARIAVLNAGAVDSGPAARRRSDSIRADAGAGGLDPADPHQADSDVGDAGDAGDIGDVRDAGNIVFIDPVRPSDFRVVVFGAGHVGRALVAVLAHVPCAVTWIDSRDDAFPATVPANVEAIVTDVPEAEVDAAPSGSYFLVMTHDHALDERITGRILRGTDFAYLGLIGSLTKRRQFEKRLAARGIDAADLARIVCPIGVPGIAGKEPGVIAVAVAAQLLERRAQVDAQRSPVERDRSAGHAGSG